MYDSPHRYELSLAPRGLLEIPDIAGVRVACKEGCLWLTLDHDQRDIVLEAGQSFVTPQHRRALIYALQASTLALRVDAGIAHAEPAPHLSFVPGALAA